MKKILFNLLLSIIPFGLQAQDTITINSSNYKQYLDLGRQYYKEYKYKKAIQLLEKLYEFDSKDVQVTNQLAEFYANFNNRDKAVAYLRETLSNDSLNLFALLTFGDLLLKTGNPGDAQICYMKVVHNVDSTNYYAYRQLGKIYYGIGAVSYDLAAECFGKALKNNPYDMVSYAQLGNIYNMINQPRLADSICTVGLKVDSLNISLLSIKGYAQYNMKLYNDAISTFSRSLKSDTTAFALKYTGLAYLNMNNFDQTEFFIERSICYDTTDLEPYIVMGQVCLQKYKFEKGLAYLNRGEKIHYPPARKWSEMFKIKADIYNQQNKWDEAMECYQQGYKLNPEDITLVCKMAYQYDYLNQKDKAIKYYSWVVDKADASVYKGEVKLAKDRLQLLQKAKGKK